MSTDTTNWNFLKTLDTFAPQSFPKLTIIIPTYNSSRNISLSLDSLLEQEYPELEIIIIDASSTDRTLDIIRSYNDPHIRMCSVTSFNRFEMLNKGISMANGFYINFLFPGDYYIDLRTLKFIMNLANEKDHPDLVYGGSIIRDGRSEAKILNRELTTDLLKKGQQPTSLQSCFFLTDTLRNMGKFEPDLSMRGGLEILCRFLNHPQLKVASTKRVLTDYDLLTVSRRMVLRHFWETFRIIKSYFGYRAVFQWLLIQKDIKRFFKIWSRKVKSAFLDQR
jgi:glycosyltransferase involved in cell wall biosynthesis